MKLKVEIDVFFGKIYMVILLMDVYSEKIKITCRFEIEPVSFEVKWTQSSKHMTLFNMSSTAKMLIPFLRFLPKSILVRVVPRDKHAFNIDSLINQWKQNFAMKWMILPDETTAKNCLLSGSWTW